VGHGPLPGEADRDEQAESEKADEGESDAMHGKKTVLDQGLVCAAREARVECAAYTLRFYVTVL
jgi:hypothetical protein